MGMRKGIPHSVNGKCKSSGVHKSLLHLGMVRIPLWPKSSAWARVERDKLGQKRQARARSQRTLCAMLKVCDFILLLVGNHWGNSSTEVTCSDFLKNIILGSVQRKSWQRISLEKRRPVKTLARNHRDLN